MEQRPHKPQLVGYLAQVSVGLTPFVVVAVMFHAYVAAEALVAAVIVAATATGNLILRDEL